jgi:DNA-directed RNA polymerase specialized sigma24 family protein
MMIIEHRTDVRWLLLEWGAWRRSFQVGPKRVRSWWGAQITDRFVEHVTVLTEPDIIVDEARAWATDRAINGTLPEDLQVLLMHQYVIGGSRERKAVRCGLSLTTFKRRRRQAEQQLQKKLQETYCDMARKSEIINTVE